MNTRKMIDAAHEALLGQNFSLAFGIYTMLRDQGERNDDPMLTAHAKENLGVIAMMQGDYDTYSLLMEEALAHLQETGNIKLQSGLLDTLAAYEIDHFKRKAHLELNLTLKQDLGDVEGQIAVLNALGDAEMEGGDTAAAESYRQRAKDLQG